ncbi:hypothetical protein H4S01_001459 [Coemansia sp. RSA 2610]|nr:hypothetical protein H4S01_001459 [Coemansia sp. RSA 2610]
MSNEETITIVAGDDATVVEQKIKSKFPHAPFESLKIKISDFFGTVKEYLDEKFPQRYSAGAVAEAQAMGTVFL